MHYDLCVIGGGIVGLATARALLMAWPGAKLIVLEKEDQLGLHQTGRNSGVIHSGIYYAPGSLKARLCRAGMARTKEYCQAKGIAFEDRGKLIVATSPLEVERLRALEGRAQVHGIAVEALTGAEISRREPAIEGLAGLHVPSSAIVNYGAVLAAMAEDVRALGGEIAMGTAPVAIRERMATVELDLGDLSMTTSALISCAGLQSDRVARMAGMDADFAIVPFRGEYYRLPPHRKGLVHAMIYPVPDPDLPFLGIHLTPMIDGSISLGPNAVLGLAREGYAKGAVSLRDMADELRFPGLWRLIRKNLKSGLDEMGNSLLASRYLAACRKYCPQLEIADLMPMRAGIRAQAVRRDGAMVQDFLVLETARMLHVCNAPSPAATSSLPIADYIAERLLSRLRD
ncbi:MAG: L-2-hydroxyglutarate oxidase [Devosia sp.]|uniref:L-2-hydroxyglutarate oxidase n=1 Tax=Devosia sp. TaxID=1871048 RepID=UPI001A0FA16C|nr:L-2-hydroxyglutarate oxidase [Devosia sp.]MBF0677766.1 L-2-hydroxyglutarate oxidase [Devosia sp.]